MNLILIDDDLLVTTALKIILEADPELHVIATGTSGAEAIMLYDIHRPDLLLLDIRMKDMSGLVRHSRSCKSILPPVFYCSQHFPMTNTS